MNVSKLQYYEFRHNIMNLGNQNRKYSWQIRDLVNPQTGTQFANSVLMYEIWQCKCVHNKAYFSVLFGSEYIVNGYHI